LNNLPSSVCRRQLVCGGFGYYLFLHFRFSAP
jgi:hypothetical protein